MQLLLVLLCADAIWIAIQVNGSETNTDDRFGSALIESSGEMPSQPAGIGKTSEPIEQNEKAREKRDESPSLDDLLRQARGGDVASHETTLRQLESREAVGQAVKSTLEVADEIAAYGDAGVNLMNDASLEQVVESLVHQRQKSRDEALQAVVIPERHLPVVEHLSVGTDTVGFDAFDAVFLQRQPRPVRAGLMRREHGEFVILYAGQTKTLDGDRVRLLRITEEHGQHVLVFDVNGHERKAVVR